MRVGRSHVHLMKESRVLLWETEHSKRGVCEQEIEETGSCLRRCEEGMCKASKGFGERGKEVLAVVKGGRQR